VTGDELVRALLAERFPPLAVVERERPPTSEDFERRRLVLLDATARYGRRRRERRDAA
jgi:hypothetical protein